MFIRDRFANCEAGDLPADGIMTAIGQVGGQTVEKVVGEKVTLEEMGGAKMHCTVSGCGMF